MRKSLSIILGLGCAVAECIAQAEPLPAALEHMAEFAKKQKGIVYDICMIKDGKSYVKHVTPSNNCHNTYSVAKAFTVTAIGILQDRGMLKVDDKIYPLFKDLFPEDVDPKWKEVSIRNLMMHRTGFAPKDNLDIDARPMTDYPEDHLRHAFSIKLTYEPGTKNVYTDLSFYILSRVVTAVSGRLLNDFLRDELFRPMKYREYALATCPLGYPIGATGFYITTEDMAKLGLLYLQKGVYNGKRILSEDFVNQALGTFELHKTMGGYAKGGMAGQLLYFNYDKNVVIAIHGFNDNPSEIIKSVLDEL